MATLTDLVCGEIKSTLDMLYKIMICDIKMFPMTRAVSTSMHVNTAYSNILWLIINTCNVLETTQYSINRRKG